MGHLQVEEKNRNSHPQPLWQRCTATRYENYFPDSEQKNSQRASRSTDSTEGCCLALKRAAIAPPGRKQRDCRGGEGREGHTVCRRSQDELGSETQSRMSACCGVAQITAAQVRLVSLHMRVNQTDLKLPQQQHWRVTLKTGANVPFYLFNYESSLFS